MRLISDSKRDESLADTADGTPLADTADKTAGKKLHNPRLYPIHLDPVPFVLLKENKPSTAGLSKKEANVYKGLPARFAHTDV